MQATAIGSKYSHPCAVAFSLTNLFFGILPLMIKIIHLFQQNFTSIISQNVPNLTPFLMTPPCLYLLYLGRLHENLSC